MRMLWLDLFFSFKGRIGRLAFLLGTIALVIVNNIIFWMLGINPFKPMSTGPELFLVVALWWPMLAVTAKRFHDLGMSGWWILLPYGSLVLTMVSMGFLAVGSATSSFGAVGLSIIFMVGSVGVVFWALWQVIKLFFFRGTVGPNNFGPPPRLAHELLGGSDETETAAGSRAMNAIDERARVVQASTISVARVARKAPRPTGPAKPAGFGQRGGR
jgi:uncharacterized membrane protein YhaH (DUF805 family)